LGVWDDSGLQGKEGCSEKIEVKKRFFLNRKKVFSFLPVSGVFKDLNLS